jgi:predicted nucleotidyltransferase
VQLPENIWAFLIKFVAKAKSYPEVRRIFLYGSYAQGRWNDESDIDIAVFIRNGEKEEIREVYKRLSALCYDYPLDVQIQVFFESELQNPMGIVEEITEYGIEISNLS